MVYWLYHGIYHHLSPAFGRIFLKPFHFPCEFKMGIVRFSCLLTSQLKPSNGVVMVRSVGSIMVMKTAKGTSDWSLKKAVHLKPENVVVISKTAKVRSHHMILNRRFPWAMKLGNTPASHCTFIASELIVEPSLHKSPCFSGHADGTLGRCDENYNPNISHSMVGRSP